MRGERLAGGLDVVSFLVACFFIQGRSLESASFIRGDADASGRLEITDGIRVLGYLFLGDPASLDCEEAADADASGAIDISDAVYLLNHLFGGGAAPGAPFPDCGPSPAPGGLECTAFPACGNEPPRASFTYSPQRGRAPLEVTFDGSSSMDPEGAALTYAWSFGDGATGGGPRVTHLYRSPGSYTVTLTVTDPAGDSATVTTVLVVEGETEPTSFELIDRALAAGEIDAETALIYRVFHVFDDDRLPATFRGGAITLVDTHIIAEVIERYDELSDPGRAVLAPFLIPPAAAGSWLDQGELEGGGGSSHWQTVVSPSGKVKVWSQTRYPGDSAKAATIAGAVDGIWDRLVGLMGREPLSDGEVSDPNGGDSKFDIYLVRIRSSGETNVYEAGYSCTAPNPVYLLIDGTDANCLLPVVAHEIMHAIQWSYVGGSGCISGENYRWWMEASATWAEEYVFRKEKNECQAGAQSVLSHPEEPLEFSGEPYDPYHLHPYGAYLWPYYLERASGRPDYVRDIWENCATFGTALEAIDKSVPEGFRRWWPGFALYNWNDHPEFNYRDDGFVLSASRADPATGRPHPDGETFTPVELDGRLEMEIPLFAKVQHLSSAYYHFTFPDQAVRHVAFEHFFDLEFHPTARVQAMILMEGDIEYRYEDWTETPLKTFCRDKATEELRDLVIILTNSEWENRSHVLSPARDPFLFARTTCDSGGAWTGTITNVRLFEENSRSDQVGVSVTQRRRECIEQRWEISPRVIRRVDSGCESQVLVEAIWSGSVSVDDFTESRGRCPPWCAGEICVATSTQVDRVESARLPSGFVLNHRCGNTYHVLRASGEWIGAPETGMAQKPTGYKEVRCDGEFFFDLPPLEIRETWDRPRLVFTVTDPSKRETFTGEETDRREGKPPFGDGVSIHTNTWTWDLTREPD